MFERYAIYYTATGPFASAGAAWLGWDVDTGQTVAQPQIDGLDVEALTQTPRKYGFHGTLKAPFRLADGKDEAQLRAALESLARGLSAVELAGLELAALGRFIALVPQGDDAPLRALAGDVVRGLDAYRAPLTEEELARRRKAHLSPAQEANLQAWGYPHVMDQFRFHMTLTGRMPKARIAKVLPILKGQFAHVLPKPLCIDALTLVGQETGGGFRTIARVSLNGAGQGGENHSPIG